MTKDEATRRAAYVAHTVIAWNGYGRFIEEDATTIEDEKLLLAAWDALLEELFERGNKEAEDE